MAYQIKICTKGGKVTEGKEKVNDIFSSLDDGYYIMTIEAVNPLLTPRDCQNAYFAMVDVVAMHTGNTRYTIHEEYKKFSGLQTTSDLEVSQWKDVLRAFRWWAYNEFDCVV